MELLDIKDAVLGEIYDDKWPPGKLYGPQTSERVVELVEAVRKPGAAFGSAARLQGKAEQEREREVWKSFCTRLEEGCVVRVASLHS